MIFFFFFDLYYFLQKKKVIRYQYQNTFWSRALASLQKCKQLKSVWLQ